MKTIIAPTDFSPASLNAVDYAADIARTIGAQMILFHVCSSAVLVSEVPVPAYSVEDLESDAQQQMSMLKEELMDRLGGGIKIYSEVKSGDVLTELNELCCRIRPYAVVMGPEEANVFERFLFGGKTVAALKKLQWPLLVVPPRARFKNFRKIGLACDLHDVVGSVHANKIKELVEEFRAELHVLHVTDINYNTYSPQTVEESGMLQEMLNGMNPQYHFIANPEVEEGIIEFAEANTLDLLIVIPKKHDLLSKIFKHRHSKHFALHTPIPLLAIHE